MGFEWYRDHPSSTPRCLIRGLHTANCQAESMIVCPNCNHQNPEGATQCEACFTPLPAMVSCPNCGASVQADANFCGQCGFNLQSAAANAAMAGNASFNSLPSSVPELVPPDPLVAPDPLSALLENSLESPVSLPVTPPPLGGPPTGSFPASTPQAPVSQTVSPPPMPASGAIGPKTQLQQQTAYLLHLQTNTQVELPQNLSIIHIGKPNDRVPPDIDVSGFANSDIVSRIHADIRVEGGIYYIEDVGSSNGTYINNMPLAPGNRHRLRPGDRVSLGKGDLVTFLFQLA